LIRRPNGQAEPLPDQPYRQHCGYAEWESTVKDFVADSLWKTPLQGIQVCVGLTSSVLLTLSST
jgi:hypothetical protein